MKVEMVRQFPLLQPCARREVLDGEVGGLHIEALLVGAATAYARSSFSEFFFLVRRQGASQESFLVVFPFLSMSDLDSLTTRCWAIPFFVFTE